jgi:hypothetical protein
MGRQQYDMDMNMGAKIAITVMGNQDGAIFSTTIFFPDRVSAENNNSCLLY